MTARIPQVAGSEVNWLPNEHLGTGRDANANGRFLVSRCSNSTLKAGCEISVIIRCRKHAITKPAAWKEGLPFVEELEWRKKERVHGGQAVEE